MKSTTILLFYLLIPRIILAQTTGYFGGDASVSPEFSSNSSTGDTWVKLAELTLNGNYSSAGIIVDFYPRNSRHGDSRQQLNVQFRTDNGSGISSSTYDLVLFQFHGQHKIIKDAKIVHTSGTGVSNLKLSVWVQIGISWLYDVPIVVRTTGTASCATSNQPFYSSITESGTTYNLRTFYGMVDTKFIVDGTISASEVKVSNTPNSDYVFEPDYDLKSLQEVESFIQQNKHLPDIPSAEEFQENGVGLGEMDDMLLRKVEELTLYMIQMQKQMDELKAENGSLKNEINNLKTDK